MSMRAAFFVALCTACAPVCAENYDWGYLVSGDAAVAPIQVFDNGRKTYFHFRQPEPGPAIFAVTPAGQIVLSVRRDGQFTVVDRIEQQFAIALGQGRATVRYNGKRDNPPAMFGSAVPVKVTGSAPAPVPASALIAARKTVPIPDAQEVKTDAPSAPTDEQAAALATATLVETQSTAVPATVNEISPLASEAPLAINLAANPLGVAKVDALLPEFSINAGERLKPALARWLSTMNYTLAWEATSSTAGRMRDIVYAEAMTKKCDTIQELLLELLDGYSLKVFISDQERKVVVRNEDNSTR
jgi:hypothetical protein